MNRVREAHYRVDMATVRLEVEYVTERIEWRSEIHKEYPHFPAGKALGKSVEPLKKIITSTNCP